MRLFRKKSESQSGHQEYLDGLITSIRKARREEEEEEKPGLQAFIEEEYYPEGQPGSSPRVPPGAPRADGGVEEKPAGEDAEAVADLEAYLSKLNEAEAARSGEEETEED
jgi:hypothetical protein